MRKLTKQQIKKMPKAFIMGMEVCEVGGKLLNPFDPDCTDYYDFIEGYSYEEELKVERDKFDISAYKFSGHMRAIGPGQCYVTLSEDGQNVVVKRKDVIALARHFKLTAEDLK